MSLESGDIYIDALVGGSWKTKPGTGAVLTYNFMNTAPTDVPDGDVTGFAVLTAVQQDGVKKALATWAAVANVSFFGFSGSGDIQFGTSNQGTDSGGFAYMSRGPGDPAYVFTNNVSDVNFSFGDGGYGLMTIIHEIGHALGLKHPGDYNAGGAVAKGPFLPEDYDNTDYTLMSYNDGYAFYALGKYAATPMMLDIQAVQYLYGANMTYHAFADTYRVTTSTAPMCIWDAGGTDTLDFSGCSGKTVIDLNEASFSSTGGDNYNVSIAYNVVIERAIAGNGGSVIITNEEGNTIIGGTGDDLVYLGGGDDVVTGGGGKDTAVFYSDYSDYLLSGTTASLKVVGDGTDMLNGIKELKFDDRTIDLSGYVAVRAGTSLKDVITAGAGNELVTGGAGLDVEKFGGARANYTVKADGGAFTVTDLAGNGGKDLLGGIERLQFADGSGVALDIDGAAGQTYRLYQAAFNRKPDAGGVGFWLDQLDHGLTLLKMAQFFLDSPESVRTYGALDNTAFVKVMYQNVLHRAPDAEGLKFYLDGFDAGAFTRAQALQGFSESAENQAAVIGSITNGVEYTIV
jgi:hypothetical protein